MLGDSLYNKVQTFPINGNTKGIGLDKLVFDLPATLPLQNTLQLSNEMVNMEVSTREVKSGYGMLKNSQSVIVKKFDNNYRFITNPINEIYGNNFYTLSREQLYNYLKELTQVIGVDVFKANLRQGDLQSTIKMKFKPKSYYDVLGLHKDLIKHLKYGGSSLYYDSKSKKQKYKTLLFYDKILEMRGKKVAKDFDNFLRYEARYYNKFLKTIASKFGKSNLLVEDLFNDTVYGELIDWWYKDYQSIFKEKKSMFDLDRITKPSDIDKLLASKAIQDFGGVEPIVKMIEASNTFDNKKAPFISKVKGRVKSLASDRNIVLETPFLEELDNKIKEAYNYSIGCLSS
tara:strand:- start:15540 stop:16571 length:1032 start_codon:yes stop_codon:yes gene_type:complete